MARTRVAIIGAGIAGLSCAHELESLGLQPVIYEVSRSVGHPFPHMGAVLEILYRCVTRKDILQFARLSYGITLKPERKVKKITHISARNRSTIQGDFGYFFTRGKLENSLENQIYHLLNGTTILFDQDPDWRELAKEYAYVVVATAKKDIPAALGIWQNTISYAIIGGTVLGDFDEDTLFVWLNRDYSKKGYGYLAPYNSRRASLVLSVAASSTQDLLDCWKKFFAIEKLHFRVVEEFQATLSSGIVYPHRTGNVFFAGVSGGFLDPLLGMGALSAVASGVIAARSIVYGMDYDKELTTLSNLMQKIKRLNRAFARLNNAGIDRLLGTLCLPGVQDLIYRTKIDVIDYLDSYVKIANKIKGSE